MEGRGGKGFIGRAVGNCWHEKNRLLLVSVVVIMLQKGNRTIQSSNVKSQRITPFGRCSLTHIFEVKRLVSKLRPN